MPEKPVKENGMMTTEWKMRKDIGTIRKGLPRVCRTAKTPGELAQLAEKLGITPEAAAELCGCYAPQLREEPAPEPEEEEPEAAPEEEPVVELPPRHLVCVAVSKAPAIEKKSVAPSVKKPKKTK